MRILLLEDDLETASAVGRGLTRADHEVAVAATSGEALQLVALQAFDVAVLDAGLPAGAGYRVLERIRAAHPQTRVILLTARGSAEDRVAGLDRAADDTLAKPFAFAELAERLSALDRRTKSPAAEVRAGPLVLDLMHRTARVRGERLDLTPTQFTLLVTLIDAGGMPVTRRDLLRDVWGYEFDPGTNVVDVHVNRLRRKLEERDLGDVIRTVRGRGYAAG